MSVEERVSIPSMPPADPAQPRSVRFRMAREREWGELEDILARALGSGLSALTEEQLHRLPLLYRSAVSSLNVARKTAMDRALVGYLEALVGRAYLAVYTSRRPERGPITRLLVERFPREVRRMWPELSLSVALFSLGTIIAFALVLADSEWFFAFVAEELAGGRTPGATTEFLRSGLYEYQDEHLTFFASFLFNHNARIGLLAFAVGFAAGLPTAWLIFANGLMLGAFGALFHERGLLIPLLGWLLPHGVPEISAIILCGAAGFTIGRAVIAPGERTVREALAESGKRAAIVAAGSVVLFLVAGLVEGIFRQMVTNDVARFGMASFNALWLTAWLLLGGRREERAEREAARIERDRLAAARAYAPLPGGHRSGGHRPGGHRSASGGAP